MELVKGRIGVDPMLAVAGEPPSGPEWAHEIKWDGVRVIARVTEAGTVRLDSRTGNNVTNAYPEIVAALSRLAAGRSMTLDGEVVAPDVTGRPDIGLLQRRMHVHSPEPVLVRLVPVVYHVFDLLDLDGASVTGCTYQQRRHLLDGLGLDGGPGAIRVPPYHTGMDGAQLLEITRQHGLEGIVSKRLNSTYQSGLRSTDWVKAVLRVTREVVISGWRSGKGRGLGSLMMGAYDGSGRLQYLGDVGSGFTEEMLDHLARLLSVRAQQISPFDRPINSGTAAHWVRPDLVGEVAYRTITSNGRLRYTRWRGLRIDKTPAEVVCP